MPLNLLRAAALPLLLAGLGCGESMTVQTTNIRPTPSTVLNPEPPPAAKPAAPTARLGGALASMLIGQGAEAEVKLVKINFNDFRAALAANKSKAKYTIVDAWATDCGPCKENFPHLVEMHHKYASRGLHVISLTLDDPTDARAVRDAEKFLKEKKAAFTNYLLDEDAGTGYEKLDINAIPAVFVFGPDGKEVKRFTLDDPDKQFTYEEVEKFVDGLLASKK